MRPRGSSLSFRRPAVAPSDPLRNDVGHRACEDLESRGACHRRRKCTGRGNARQTGRTHLNVVEPYRIGLRQGRATGLKVDPGRWSGSPGALKTAAAEAPGRGAGGSGGGGGSGGAGATRARERPPVDRVRRLRRPGGRRRPASRPCRRLGAPAAADVRGACSTQVAARERKGPERSPCSLGAPGPRSTYRERSLETPPSEFCASSPWAGRTGRQRPEGEAPRSSLRRRAVGRHAPGGGAAPRRPPRWEHS